MTARIDYAKVVFYVALTLIALGLAFAIGLYSAHYDTALYKGVLRIKTTVEESWQLVTEEASTLTGTHPKHFLEPARRAGAGVTVNTAPDQDALVLIAGFFDDNNGVRLLRRDGTIVANWPVSFSKLFPDTRHTPEPPATDWNVDTHGTLILPDGSIVFNFEYSGLVKLDRCGSTLWTLPARTHHSIEIAEGGGYWVPGRYTLAADAATEYPPFEPPYEVDTIMRVSDAGEILEEFSVPGLFYDSGLAPLLTSTGYAFHPGTAWDNEIVHVNKIAELRSDIAADFPLFAAGDLLLSMRSYNLLAVADPNTRRIKWWKIGPWIRQHDPEFRAGGTIVVFNNNLYRNEESDGTRPPGIPGRRTSNIIEIDPVTGATEIIYGEGPGHDMVSAIRGKVELTPAGGLVITEFEGGRVLETDAAGATVWEYINRYSDKEVAEVTEARVYPADYFSVTDWACRGERSGR